MLFLAVIFLIIGGAGRALYLDFQRPTGIGLTEEIGTVVFKQKVAERKFSHQAVFGAVRNQSTVYNYDTVRTGRASAASVILADGTTINLDEETMVGLELTKSKGGKRLTLNVGGGKIAAQRKAGSESSVSLKTEKAEISFTEGNLSLQSSGENITFEGDAELTVTAGGKTETVAARDQVSLVGTVVSRIETSVTLETPSDEAYLITAARSVPVDFRWTGGVGSEGQRLQLSKSRDFAVLAFDLPTTGGTSTVSVSEGSWYWRVVSENGPTADLVRRFTVLADDVPRPLRPADGEGISGTKKTLIPLTWTPSAYASSYRLEVYDETAPEKPLIALAGTMTSLSVELPENGSYSWRVVGLYPLAGKELAGPKSNFELRRINELDRPLSHPTKNFSMENRKSAVLAWDRVEGADTYEVTLWAAGNRERPVFTTHSPGNYLKLPQDLPEGEYSWEVKARTEDIASAPSETRTFRMFKLLPVELIEPKGQLPEPAAGKTFRFSWNDRNDGERYKVELSSDKDFANVRKVFETERGAGVGGLRSSDFVLDQPGRYYWRVSILDDEKAGELSRAVPLEFVLPDELPRPALISPAPDSHQLIYVFDDLSFSWQPVRGANLYRLLLYRVVLGRENLVYSVEAPGPVFRFNRFDLLSDDRYIWKLIAYDRQGAYNMKMSPAAAVPFTFQKKEFLDAPSPAVPSLLYLPPVEPTP